MSALGLFVGLVAAAAEADAQGLHGDPAGPLRQPVFAGDVPEPVRPALMPAPSADFGIAESTRASVESPAISFGEVLVGEPMLQPGSLVVRVVSPQPWMLRLVPLSELERNGGDEPVPLSRLSWRGGMAGGFVSFEGREPVTVAEGPPTGSGGRLVILDLKLELTDTDPTGEYSSRFRVQVEPH